MSRELRLRILSGIVMAVVVLATTWYGGIAFRVLSALIGLLIFYEWSTISGLAARGFPAFAFGWLSVVCVALNTVFGDNSYALPLAGGFAVTSFLFVLAGKSSLWLPGGVLYAGLTCVSLSAIRADDGRGLIAMLFIFAIVWGTDILAYFVGRAIGGPKLAPRISPGKTWSGAIGGAVAGVIAGTAVVFAVNPETGIRISLIAFVLSVASQLGDLFESYVKRRFGVKDSSHMIPGHGGVMDRVDGLIFASVLAFFLAVGSSAANTGILTSVGGFLLGW